MKILLNPKLTEGRKSKPFVFGHNPIEQGGILGQNKF